MHLLLTLEFVRLRNEDQKFKDCLGVHKRESSFKKKVITKQEQNQNPNDKEKHPKL